MIELWSEMFSFPFMVRATVVGVLIALCASLLGVPLVLKRFSMIGDGLSHVGFGALSVATAMNVAPLSIALPVVVVAAFFLLKMKNNSKIKGDAAIALISTTALAIGVIIISLSTGMNTDVCNYLFGSILGLSKNDVYLSCSIAIIVILLFVLLYNRIFAITFDETFVQATGKTQYNTMIIAILTALVIVIGMRMMGSLLISCLIVFPALTAMRICKTFLAVTINSGIISVVCFLLGMTFSYVYATPTGASVVMCNVFAFIIYSFVAFAKSFMQGKKNRGV